MVAGIWRQSALSNEAAFFSRLQTLKAAQSKLLTADAGEKV
jgi:hypothetical protein